MVGRDAGKRRDVRPALIGLVVVMFSIPSILVVQPLGGSATPAALLGMALFLWWSASRLLGPMAGDQPAMRPLHLSLAFFGATVLLSNWAGNLWARTPLEMRSADRALLVVMAWAGIALATADGIATRRSLDRVLRALVIGAAAMATLGLIQFFFGLDISRFVRFPGLSTRLDLAFIQERSGFNRVAGTAGHPIEFGVTLAILLPLAVHYAVTTRGRSRRVFIVCLGIVAAAMPMSLSRSATLGGVVAGAVLFAGWSNAQRKKALIIVPAFAIVMRLLVPGLLGTIRSLFMNLSSDPSIQGRTQDYAYVEQFFAQSPIVGRGYGTFIPELYTTLDNTYLGLVVETGLLGVAAMLTIFLVGIACARGVRRRAPDEETRHLALSLTASISVALVTFATFDSLAFPMVTTSLFLVLGGTAALWRLTVNEYGYAIPHAWATPPPPAAGLKTLLSATRAKR